MEGSHLASFETVCQKSNSLAIWPFPDLFLILRKYHIFRLVYEKYEHNLQYYFTIFYEILNLKWLKIWRKFILYLCYFYFWWLGLFETAYGQIWPFLIFGLGNPGVMMNCGGSFSPLAVIHRIVFYSQLFVFSYILILRGKNDWIFRAKKIWVWKWIL